VSDRFDLDAVHGIVYPVDHAIGASTSRPLADEVEVERLTEPMWIPTEVVK
jgi:hypothetical protein